MPMNILAGLRFASARYEAVPFRAIAANDPAREICPRNGATVPPKIRFHLTSRHGIVQTQALVARSSVRIARKITKGG